MHSLTVLKKFMITWEYHETTFNLSREKFKMNVNLPRKMKTTRPILFKQMQKWNLKVEWKGKWHIFHSLQSGKHNETNTNSSHFFLEVKYMEMILEREGRRGKPPLLDIAIIISWQFYVFLHFFFFLEVSFISFNFLNCLFLLLELFFSFLLQGGWYLETTSDFYSRV